MGKDSKEELAFAKKLETDIKNAKEDLRQKKKTMANHMETIEALNNYIGYVEAVLERGKSRVKGLRESK